MALVPTLRKRGRGFYAEEFIEAHDEALFEGKLLKKLKEGGTKSLSASPSLRKKVAVVELSVVECQDCKVRVPLKDLGLTSAPTQWRYRCYDCQEMEEESYDPGLVFGMKEE